MFLNTQVERFWNIILSIVSPVSLHNTGGFQPLNNSAVLLVFPNCKIISTVSRIPDQKIEI